jgi:Fe-S cluster assembly ATPase SufC
LGSFQSPVEVPGVSNSDFLRLAANARRKQLGLEELGPLEFYGFVMPKVLHHMSSPLRKACLLQTYTGTWHHADML